MMGRYLEDPDNKRNRSYFANGTIRVLLFSGRYRYFKRMNIRGANTIFFISPPSYPELWSWREGVTRSYSDFVNSMNSENKEGKELSVGVTVLYTKFDTYAVEPKEGDDV